MTQPRRVFSLLLDKTKKMSWICLCTGYTNIVIVIVVVVFLKGNFLWAFSVCTELLRRKLLIWFLVLLIMELRLCDCLQCCSLCVVLICCSGVHATAGVHIYIYSYIYMSVFVHRCSPNPPTVYLPRGNKLPRQRQPNQM